MKSVRAAMPAARAKILQETVNAVSRYGSKTAAAAALGIPRTTLGSRLEELARWQPKRKTSKSKTVSPPPLVDKAALKRIAEAEAKAAKAEADRQALEALHLRRQEKQPAWGRVSLGSANSSLTPILFTSDFQVGEVIRPEEVDGLNEYNQEVFKTRYEMLIEKTIRLATHNTGAKDFPGILYLRGGDAVSGEIHEELADTNDLSSIPACKLLHAHERAGIRRLKEAFKRVRVISIPGNHGRTVRKPRTKSYTARNYETLLGWWLADSFESDTAISFWQPPSGDACFEVEGWRFLLSHGDRMGSRGGQGFLGPLATVIRGHQKLYTNYAATGQHVDCILTGHLHTSAKLERGFANGSVAGYSELARDIRAIPAPPKQWLLFIHRENFVSHHFEVTLGPQPKRVIEECEGEM